MASASSWGLSLALAIALATAGGAGATRALLQTPTPSTSWASPYALITSPQYKANFTVLVSLLKATSLTDAFSNGTAFVNTTVLLPTDAAFADLLKEMSVNTSDVAAVTKVLMYHIWSFGTPVTFNWTKSPGSTYVDMEDTYITFERDDALGKAIITDQVGRMATVTVANLKTGAGISQIIDKVMWPFAPANIINALNYSSTWTSNFTAVLTNAPMNSKWQELAMSATSNVTLLCPINPAFAYMPNGTFDLMDPVAYDAVLSAHFVKGGGRFANTWDNGTILETYNANATFWVNKTSDGVTLVGQGSVAGYLVSVVFDDILGSANGTQIHLIDAVIVPDTTPTPSPPKTWPSVWDYLNSTAELSVWAQFCEAIDAVAYLSGPALNNCTVFLPTNEGAKNLFASVPTDGDAIARFWAILNNHIYCDYGALSRADFPTVPGARMVDSYKQYITVKRTAGLGVYFSDQVGRQAYITSANKQTGGAISHVISNGFYPYNSTDVSTVINKFLVKGVDPAPKYTVNQFLSAATTAALFVPQLADMLNSATANVTILAPYDGAAWPNPLPTDPQLIGAVVATHLVAGASSMYSWSNGTVLELAIGQFMPKAKLVYFVVGDWSLLVGAANGPLAGQWAEIIDNDILGTSGTTHTQIHILSNVFMPLPGGTAGRKLIGGVNGRKEVPQEIVEALHAEVATM